METCPGCSRAAPAGSRFCPVCATPLGVLRAPAPTPSPDDATPEAPPGSAPPSGVSSSALPGDGEPRFVPGTVLAGRYRIVGLLGRGGMGEVYRADDLKLGQSVALKFLPRGLEQDPERLQRFLGEVKVALKITHPNVCRVYDLGEVDGAHFLSMEYIDGEDLSSLLRRIGRLPEDKAVQIARQLCAGLAAAHDQGILHRDLKPANVMVDGRGDVKITDFGLAGLAAGFSGVEIRAGTPAFMAPEQLSGREVTVKSDIYALGLVLYQLFTGKRAFEGATAAEISKLQQSGPMSLSSHVRGLDPAVEQVILRCLAADPAKRPGSVVKVALGLPGADPLAAALAAGETPSPEMVADSGDDSGLAPRVAVPVAAFALLGLLAASWIVGRVDLLGRVPMELPAQVLAHRAQEIAESLGHGEAPVDRAHRFQADWRLLRHLDKDPSPGKWDALASENPSAISLWYRQSPRPLVPQHVLGQVLFNDPPARMTGMIKMMLHANGELRYFQAVPPQLDAASAEPAEPDWGVALEAAGLDPAALAPATPKWTPEVECDLRRAWTGRLPVPGTEPIEIQVEAGAFGGRIVYFDVLYPWDNPWRQEEFEGTATQRLQRWVDGGLFLVVLIGALVLVHRNLKLGRGDRQGALALAGWVVAANLGAWLFQASHASHPQHEIGLFLRAVGNALVDGGQMWLLYIALEPFVRRRWPESLVSWKRLLAGRFRDPLVGRHLLYGAALGVAMELLEELGNRAPTFFGKAAGWPGVTDLDTLLGTRWVLGEVFFSLRHAVFEPMKILFVLVLLRVVLRNRWLALAAFVGLTVFFELPDAELVAFWIGPHVLLWTLVGLFAMRFGLVSIIAGYFFGNELLANQPMTLDFSTWYAGSTLTALALGVALILFAFKTSLGGRPLFAEED